LLVHTTSTLTSASHRADVACTRSPEMLPVTDTLAAVTRVWDA